MNPLLAELVAEARKAAAADEPAKAIRALLAETLTRREAMADAIAESADDEVLLFEDDTCSIWTCRYDPDVVLAPHEHAMAVHVAVYRGTEIEVLYKREPGGMRHGGNKHVEAGDVISLGRDAIHAITSAGPGQSHAIHIYEGPLTQVTRSLFDWSSGAEIAFTMENFHAMKRVKTEMAEFQ